MSKDKAIVPRSPFKMIKALRKTPEKVVFLNDKNLEVLKGYKAYVQIRNEGEIHLTITGLSKQSIDVIFDKLEALNPKE